MRSAHRKLRLCILGPPGSGKTTQARRLSEICGLAHIYAGELLRREATGDSVFAQRINEKLRAGQLVSSDIVLHLVEREIVRAHGKFILDGFPRNLEQALEFGMVMKALGERLDAVIYIDLADSEAIERLLRRGRTDDTTDIIRLRLATYHSQTIPLMRYYDNEGLLLTLPGRGEVDAVTERILNGLRARIPEACTP